MPDTDVQNTDTTAQAVPTDDSASTTTAATTTQATAPVVPETYTFKLPDGVVLAEATAAKVSELFKGANLTQESAQSFIDLYTAQLQSNTQAWEDLWTAEKAKWQTDLKADKEIGGDKLDATVARAREAIAKFGSPALTALLQETGYEGHPEIIRVFAKVGAIVSEDHYSGPRSASGGERSLADRLYSGHPN